MCSFYKIIFVLCSLFFVLCLACGGDGSSPPVFNDSGICLANCPDINVPDKGKDGFKSDLADIYGGDQPPDGSTDQAEVEPYVCPSEIPPLEQYEACMPKGAKNSYCWGLGEIPNPKCGGGGFFESQPCTTDSFCQQVPEDKWPPCVCWQFCGYAGEWDCESYTITLYFNAESDGGNYCKVWNENNSAWIGQLNDPKLHGESTIYLILTDQGMDRINENGYIDHCAKK